MMIPSRVLLSLMILGALVACSPQEDAASPSPGTNTVPATGGGAAASGEQKQDVLPFIADDYVTALAEARRRDLPLFIENWAPW